MSVHGLLLAAGGTAPSGSGALHRCVLALLEGGCDAVSVVVPATAAEQAAEVLAEPGNRRVRVVFTQTWALDEAEPLRAGLLNLRFSDAGVVAVATTDPPYVDPAVVRQLLDHPAGPATLRRAAYRGVPGHPILIGRDHWPGVIAAATDARTVRTLLEARAVELVECACPEEGLGTGRTSDATHPTEEDPMSQDPAQSDDPRDDQDAGPASEPTGAAAEDNAAETEDQDAGPATEPQ